MTKEDWLVSNKTCKGCMYYGYLATYCDRCCDYTYLTGKVRHNPPSSCEVKEIGKRPRKHLSTSGCVVHRKNAHNTTD